MSQALPPPSGEASLPAADRALRATILHSETAALSLSNRWQDRCGFTVPASFGDPIAELSAIEAGAGIADGSAVTAFQISGADARDFLAAVLLGAVDDLKPGQRARVAWADDDGRLRGSGELHALGYDQFRLVSDIGDFGWFTDAAAGFTVRLDTLTGQLGAIEIVGPGALALLESAGLPVSGLGANDLRFADWLGAQARISVDGAGRRYRLWTGAADAPILWRNIARLGQDYGLLPVGALTQEALRIQLGEPRACMDWMPVQWAVSGALVRRGSDLGFDESKAPIGPAFVELRIDGNPDGPVAKPAAGGPATNIATSLAPVSPGGIVRALGWVSEASAKPGQRITLATGLQASVARRVFSAEAH